MRALVLISRSGPLILLFIWELISGATRIALLALTPNLRKRMHPGFIDYPLTLTGDVEITLFANLITLTPGTLSVDVDKTAKLLTIHAANYADTEAVIGSIAGGFETRIMELFR